MKRKYFIETAIGCAAVALAGQTATAATKVKRPNFLVILTDDQAYKAIGYKNPQVLTPNLDALAAEGTRLDSMYIASPICMASRASMMTGMYPQQHGAVALNSSVFQQKIADGTQYPTLPQMMSKAGYHTALYGKSHLGDPLTYGFDEGKETKDQNDEENRDLVIDCLRRMAKSGQPFFIWQAMHNPHVGFRAPKEFHDFYKGTVVTLDPNWREQPPLESLYNQAWAGAVLFRDVTVGSPNSGGPPRSANQMKAIIPQYWADVSCLDNRAGAVIKCLKETGLYENTIVIFLSDNGYFTGQHGLGNKTCLLEEGVRVPAFVASPLLPNKGAVSESLVSSLDIFPTLLDYAGVPIPDRLMGKSWRPILENPEAKIREYVVSESVGPPETRVGVGHRMVRGERFKYILTSSDEEAFFDLRDDPYEIRNLIAAPEYSHDVRRLRDELAGWSAAVGEKRIQVETLPPGPVGLDNKEQVKLWRKTANPETDRQKKDK